MNQEEYPTYEILSEQDRRQFLYRKGMIFLFPAGILFLSGLYWYFIGNMVFCYLCLTAGVIHSFFGIQPVVFWKKEKQWGLHFLTAVPYASEAAEGKRAGVFRGGAGPHALCE